MNYFSYENDYHDFDNQTQYSQDELMSLSLTYLIDIEELDLDEI